MKRGDIYWAELHPRSGAEQQRRRPVVVIAHDVFATNVHWQSLTCIPISTTTRRGPTVVPLSHRKLVEGSVALCHQITTLDRQKLVEHIGAVSPDELEVMEQGVLLALGIR